MLNRLKATLVGLVGLAALVAAGEFSPAHAQVQNFSKVALGSASNGSTFAVAWSQPGPWIGGGLGGSFSAVQALNPATGAKRDLYGGFTVTGGAQQVILTSTPGNAFMITKVGGKPVGKPVPINVTIVVKLTATPAPLPAGFPAGSTSRVATMVFKAVNANTGANIVTTGTLKGYTVALP